MKTSRVVLLPSLVLPCRVLACLVLPCLVLTGCRGAGDEILLERELRKQEDQIYQLRYHLDECHSALDASRQENEILKKEMGGGGDSFAPPSVELPSRRGATPTRPSRPTNPARPETRRLETPLVEPGTPDDDAAGPSLDPLDSSEPPAEDEPPSRHRGASLHETPTDVKVTQLHINPRLTGGYDRDHQPGDEAIMVVFEPRNAAGQLVEAPGAVSVAVLDETKAGASARVARWDFTTDEVAGHFHKTLMGRALQFELPWPSQPPENPDLHLFVRYTTADGRKLVADSRIHIRPADREARRRSRSTAAGRPDASRDEELQAERPSWQPYR